MSVRTMTERDILISMLMHTVLAYFDDDTVDEMQELLHHYQHMSAKELMLALLEELKMCSTTVDALDEYVRKYM